MKPIFTIHAGEYLVASEVEQNFKNINIWIPSKDTGIDLLLTDERNKKTVSLQIKYSKDFNDIRHNKKFIGETESTGWWTLNIDKISKSKADFWIFIIYNFLTKKCEYIIITPQEVLGKIELPKQSKKNIQIYFRVTKKKKAFATRGFKKNIDTEMTVYLNNWKSIKEKLKLIS